MSEESREIYTDADALAEAAARDLLRLAEQSIAERGIFTLALAGGSTPRKLYKVLASEPDFRKFPWTETRLFFGDERHVPPEDSESNYRMVSENLLASGLVPAGQVHRVQGGNPDAGQAASEYEAEMRRVFKESMRTDGFARFDVILLGMGPDGHTASLFPGSAGLEERDRWVVANWVEKFQTDRITFTFPVLNAARNVLLLVAGADKAEMLSEVFATNRPATYPVQLVKPRDGVKMWLLDRAAAARL